MAVKPKPKCPHCGQECASNAGLAAHLRAAHKSAVEGTNGTARAAATTVQKPPPSPAESPVPTPGTYKCEDCDRSFETEDGLHLHRVRIHGAEKKPLRRQSTRPRSPSPAEPPVVVNLCFCPGCGMNLKLLAHALAAIGGLQNG